MYNLNSFGLHFGHDSWTHFRQEASCRDNRKQKQWSETWVTHKGCPLKNKVSTPFISALTIFSHLTLLCSLFSDTSSWCLDLCLHNSRGPLSPSTSQLFKHKIKIQDFQLTTGIKGRCIKCWYNPKFRRKIRRKRKRNGKNDINTDERRKKWINIILVNQEHEEFSAHWQTKDLLQTT